MLNSRKKRNFVLTNDKDTVGKPHHATKVMYRNTVITRFVRYGRVDDLSITYTRNTVNNSRTYVGNCS